MKIFVAGGTGAIGRPLIAKLLAKGHALVGSDLICTLRRRTAPAQRLNLLKERRITSRNSVRIC